MSAPMPSSGAAGPVRLRVTLAGTTVDLMEQDEAVASVVEWARRPDGPPLGVVSANLDHVHHFGVGGRWHGVMEHAEACGEVRWLTLLDGAPLVTRASRLTGRSWPRLAGSDLVEPILSAAEAAGLTVGFLGGLPATQARLAELLGRSRPGLRVSGWWAPPREVLADRAASGRLADEVRASGTQILLVGMGKPRQELWIAQYGAATGVRVHLAFGAVVDFLAGRVPRAPRWVARHGMEWSYRLCLEPRRLGSRYLVDGPLAYARLRRASGVGEPPDDAGAPEPDLRSAAGRWGLEVVPALPGAEDVAAGYALLHLAPGMRLDPEDLATMLRRLRRPGVGAVTPRVLDRDGSTRQSLRFRATGVRVATESVLGDRLAGRPAWAAVVDRNPESYQHPHPVELAAGGCLLVRGPLVDLTAPRTPPPLGTLEDHLQAVVRAAGLRTWFDPHAVARDRLCETTGVVGGHDLPSALDGAVR